MKYAVCGFGGLVPSCLAPVALSMLAFGCDDLDLPADPLAAPNTEHASGSGMDRDRSPGLPADAPQQRPPAMDPASERPERNAMPDPSGNALNDNSSNENGPNDTGLEGNTPSDQAPAGTGSEPGEDGTDAGARPPPPSSSDDDDVGDRDEATSGGSLGSPHESADDDIADAGGPWLPLEGPCPSSSRLTRTGSFPSLPALLFVDEFDDPDTLDCQRLGAGLFAPGWVDGHLLIEPDRRQVPNAWHDNGIGPFVGWPVTGDFVIEASVSATLDSDPTSPPSAPYSGAGIVIFDPNPPLGLQAWLAYVIGFQRFDLGRTIKDTKAAVTTRVTNEAHGLAGLGSSSARIRICRVGQEYSFYHRVNEAEGWRVEGMSTETIGHEADAVMLSVRAADPPPPTKPFSPYRPERRDLPDLVYVGLTAESLSESGDVQGSFDRVQIARIANASQCTADIPQER